MKNGQKTIPEMSVDTRFLIERLLKAEVGEAITYEELSGIISRAVQPGGPAYHILHSARNNVLNNEGVVFEAITSVGIRRLTDTEIVETSQARVDRTRRAARSGMHRLAAVNYDGLTKDEQAKHNTYASLFGALHQMTKATSVQKLESKVSDAQAKLPLGRTLEAFKT